MKVTKDELLGRLRDGGSMSRGDKLRLVAMLSVPAMMGQLSSIVMQYIDAMMVGNLGAWASASIGLVSTTTWLFGGLAVSAGVGFSVLVAHRIGAKDHDGARDVLRQSLTFCVAFSAVVCAIGVAIHRQLPLWLGGEGLVAEQASAYFFVWCLMVPMMQLYHLSNSMLRSCGNMKVPMMIGVMMCALDVVFNLLFIPRWGVVGAAMATWLAGTVCGCTSLRYLLVKSPDLSLRGRPGSFRPRWDIIRRSLKIGLPMGAEHAVICGAQIVSTIIVAPLGTVALAANTIAITVESLCYMPGYGVSEAATTLVGQSVGARRMDLVRGFAGIAVALGIGVMTVCGIVMYVTAPELMTLMSIDEAVRQAGVSALRIEAFAEPMYAASIVVYGVFVGMGDTLVPCCMNFASIWVVRIPLAAWLAGTMGLDGVWLAMCLELCFRGVIFLARRWRKDRQWRRQGSMEVGVIDTEGMVISHRESDIINMEK